MINTKISTRVSSQLPEFVREENPLFVEFLSAYYEYLESQSNTVVKSISDFQSRMDIDTTVDGFSQKLYDEFLHYFPNEMIADKSLILKRAKDFYRSRGTEKSFKFLFRALYGKEVEIYRPQDDVLIASSGKWFIEKSIRLTDITVNDIVITELTDFQKLVNTEILGKESGAKAFVERVIIAYDSGLLKYETFISNIRGTFLNGENIITTNINNEVIEATILSGIIASITITNPGSLYNIGDPVIISGGYGRDGTAYVSAVTSGSIVAVSSVDGGAGFRINDVIQFSGGSGTGAKGNVSSLLGTANSFFHPNTYNIVYDTILLYANTTLNIANYAFPALANANINSSLSSAFSTFAFGPTGPIGTITLSTGGAGYLTTPSADPIGNTLIKTLGILGKMRIISPGSSYANGDIIRFINAPGGMGSGSNAIVQSVNALGSIEHVAFVPVPGWITGGVGYDMLHLPLCNIISTMGSGGNVVVTSLLGFGAPGTSLSVVSGTVGQIESITITNRGIAYNAAPIIDLTGSGDGTARAFSNIVTGTFTYPGRYLDDTGFLSSFNFLQDRDYYQSFSYVVKVRESIDTYRSIVRDLLHPIGTKMFGEYMFGGDTFSNTKISSQNTGVILITTNSFAFDVIRRASVLTYYYSNVVMEGLTVAKTISVSGGGDYSINGNAFINFPTTTVSGDNVTIRMKSSNTFNTEVKANLTVGSYIGTFSVTTDINVLDKFSRPPLAAWSPSRILKLGANTINGNANSYSIIYDQIGTNNLIAHNTISSLSSNTLNGYKYINFNTSNSYYTLTTPLNLGNSFTIVLAAGPSTNSSNIVVLGYSANIRPILAIKNNTVSLVSNTVGGINLSTPLDGANYIAITSNGAYTQFYVNGQFISSRFFPFADIGIFDLVGSRIGNTNGYEGALGDIIIFDYILDSANITLLSTDGTAAWMNTSFINPS